MVAVDPVVPAGCQSTRPGRRRLRDEARSDGEPTGNNGPREASQFCLCRGRREAATEWMKGYRQATGRLPVVVREGGLEPRDLLLNGADSILAGRSHILQLRRRLLTGREFR